MPVTDILAAVPVADHDAGTAWYGLLLGRAPDSTPMPGLAQWEVAGGGTLQVVHDTGRAGGALLTVVVDDLLAEVAALRARGLVPGEPDEGSVVARVTTLTDPDGSLITLVEQR